MSLFFKKRKGGEIARYRSYKLISVLYPRFDDLSERIWKRWLIRLPEKTYFHGKVASLAPVRVLGLQRYPSHSPSKRIETVGTLR